MKNLVNFGHSDFHVERVEFKDSESYSMVFHANVMPNNGGSPRIHVSIIVFSFVTHTETVESTPRQ